MARGRPRKTVLSDDDKFEEVFFKAFTPKLDANGNLVFVPSETSLTLEVAGKDIIELKWQILLHSLHSL